MAIIHVPGTGIGPHGGKHPRRAVILAAVVFACAAIVVPFALHDVGRSGAKAPAAAHDTEPSPAVPLTHQHTVSDASVGPRGNLPALLPGRARLTDGTRVRLGDITFGALRRTPDGTWRVLVLWNGRTQAVPTRGPVGIGGGSASPATTSWVSDKGLLYTRVATGPAGQFRVYAWVPRDATAYTPPTLVARKLGRVCFNDAFTAFGNCRTTG